MAQRQSMRAFRVESGRLRRRLRPDFFAHSYRLEDRTLLNGSVTVSTTNDTVDGDVTNIADLIANPGADGKISLREAIEAANNTPSAAGTPNTITVPDGTYNLTTGTAGTGNTAELPVGGNGINNNTVIVGTSEAGTIINQTVSGARIFNIDPPSFGGTLFSASDLTLQNGTSTDGGGAVLFGGDATDQATFTSVDFKNNSVTGTATNSPGGAINDAGGTLTIINSTFDSNTVGTVGTTNLGSGSGAIDVFPLANSVLNISGSTFINNKAAASASGAGGGAIRIAKNGNTVTASITGSTFTNNQVTNGAMSGGGAIYLESGSLTVTDSSFSGNQITNGGAGEDAGGAIYAGGSLTANFNRFVGNSTAKSGAGNAIAYNPSVGSTINIEDNWWGHNSGPAAGDSVGLNPTAPLVPTHWLVLTNAANPSTINVGGTSTLTADFRHDNNGTDVSALDPAVGHTFPAFIGLAVTYGVPVDGTLSNQQTSIQSGGTATATYTGTTGGSGSSTATVDGVTATASINVTASADLGVSISGPATAIAGNQITYTITETNFGPSDSPTATLTTTLPAGTTFVNLVFDNVVPDQGGETVTGGNVGNVVTQSIAPLKSGHVATISVIAMIDANQPAGMLSTTSTVSGTGITDPVSGNNSSTATTAVTTQADVTVVKAGPISVIAGNQITYTVTVSNPGPSDAQGVSLADTLPTATTFVSQNQPGTGPQFSLSNTGNAITDTIVTLAAGASQTITIVAQVAANTPIETLSNTATATTTTTDPNLPTDGTSTANTPVTTQADVTVTKTATVALLAGSQVTYTITVQNNGSSNAQGVSLTDNLPAATTFVSQNQPNTGPQFSLSNTGNALTDTIATLAAGASQTITILATINPSTPAGTVSNTATATTTTPDPNLPTHGTSTAGTAVTTQADVTVSKTATPAVIAGNQVTYTVTVSNPGPSDAQGVSLADTLPAATTFVSQNQPGTGPQFSLSNVGNALTDTIATLAAGATQTITITATVNSSTGAGSLSNTATATTSTTDPNLPTHGTSTANTTITTQADVSVVKTGPTTVMAGNNITYQITTTNAGPSDALNTLTSDTLPANTSFVSFVQNTGPSNGGTLPAGGTQTFTLVLHVSPTAPDGFTLTNTAHVVSSTTDLNTGNNTSVVNTTVVNHADVSVVKTGPATVIAGNNITYQITTTNAGPSDALNTMTSDTLPANTSLVSFVQNTGPTNGGTLPAGGTETFTLVLAVSPTAPDASTLTNTAQVSSTTPDLNTANNTSVVNTTVINHADVSILKTGPATVIAGNNITYQITTTNAGPSDALNTMTSDTLPANTSLVSFVQNTGPSNGGTLPAGGTETFTLVLHVSPSAPDASTLTNTAQVSSSTTDLNPANNTSVVNTTVQNHADLSVTKTAPGVVDAGNNLVYTIIVTNNGPSDAQNVALNDTLPAGTTFVGQGQGGGPAFTLGNVGNVITDTIATLAAGASQTFTVTTHLPASTPNGGSISNTATVSTTTTDPNLGNNSSTATTIVQTSADLVLAVISAPPSVGRGAILTYTVTLTNNGPSDSQHVLFNDALPIATTFVSQSQGGGPTFTLTNSGNSIGDSILTMPAGTAQTFTIMTKVKTTATVGASLSNSAAVFSFTPDPNLTNNSSMMTNTVSAAAPVVVIHQESVQAESASKAVKVKSRVEVRAVKSHPHARAAQSLPAWWRRR